MKWDIIVLIGTTLVQIGLTSVIVFYLVQKYIEQNTGVLAETIMTHYGVESAQIASTVSRTSKTALKKVGTDLMRNTAIGQLTEALSDDTREYLAAHPESLPEVIRGYAPTIDLIMKMLPNFIDRLGAMEHKGKISYDL